MEVNSKYSKDSFEPKKGRTNIWRLASNFADIERLINVLLPLPPVSLYHQMINLKSNQFVLQIYCPNIYLLLSIFQPLKFYEKIIIFFKLNIAVDLSGKYTRVQTPLFQFN